MFLGGGRNRIGAAVALAAVLAMVLAAPAGAAGWGEERVWAGGIVQQLLAWIGFAPSLDTTAKAGQGSGIDHNGSPKALTKHGLSIDPNGNNLMSAPTTDQGPRIDPNSLS